MMSDLSTIDPYANSYPPSLWEKKPEPDAEPEEAKPVRKGRPREQRQ